MKKFLSLTSKPFEASETSTLKSVWEKAQADGYEGLAVLCTVEMTKEVTGDTKKFHAIFSSAVEDRHGEIVFQDFDLKAFKKNPVYIDSHDYSTIESIIGRVSSISVKDGKLQGDIEFATMNPKGQLAEQMAEAGFLNTSSIGFIPKAFDDKGNILKSEMLEVSAVSVPANAEALFQNDAADDVAAPVVDEPGEVVGETRDVRGVIANTVRGLTVDRRRTLGAVAREIARLNDAGEEKRQVFKAVRALMKADVGV